MSLKIFLGNNIQNRFQLDLHNKYLDYINLKSKINMSQSNVKIHSNLAFSKKEKILNSKYLYIEYNII